MLFLKYLRVLMVSSMGILLCSTVFADKMMPEVHEILSDGKVIASTYQFDHGNHNFIILVQYQTHIYICDTYISDESVWGAPGTIKCIKQTQINNDG